MVRSVGFVQRIRIMNAQYSIRAFNPQRIDRVRFPLSACRLGDGDGVIPRGAERFAWADLLPQIWQRRRLEYCVCRRERTPNEITSFASRGFAEK